MFFARTSPFTPRSGPLCSVKFCFDDHGSFVIFRSVSVRPRHLFDQNFDHDYFFKSLCRERDAHSCSRCAATSHHAGFRAVPRVVDVDLFRKLVRVRQTVCCGKVQTPKTKSAIRDIPIPVEIVGALRAHIGDRKEGFVFTTKNGTLLNADLVSKRHLRRTLGIMDGLLHMFRHTFATRQLHAGGFHCCGVQAVRARQLLNHSQHLRSRSD